MDIKRLETLATENFKRVNNINPSYMKNIFTPKTNAKTRPHDIIARNYNTATYGNKRFTALGPEVWNKLPTNRKSLISITKFKEYIRMCLGLVNVCKMVKLFIFNGLNIFIGCYSDLICFYGFNIFILL